MTTEQLAELVLARGNHESREDGMCAMEAVAWCSCGDCAGPALPSGNPDEWWWGVKCSRCS